MVLIHGFAEDGTIWENQVTFLKSHNRLLIPDIPGSGRSELLPEATIENYAEVIKAILEADFHNSALEEPHQATIIGHSMGGYIALAFAKKYPELLHSFGLFHSTAFADNEDKITARSKAIQFIKERGSYPFLQTSIPGLFTPAFAALHPAVVNGLINRAKDFSPAALVQYYEAMIHRPSRIELLKNFPGPILFVIGEKDNVIPLQSSLEQCYLPSQAAIHILENSSHMGMLEEAERSNELLTHFLKMP